MSLILIFSDDFSSFLRKIFSARQSNSPRTTAQTREKRQNSRPGGGGEGGYGRVPGLRESTRVMGEHRGYGRVPGLRESTGVTGEYRGYGRVPGLRESTGVTGEHRGYGRAPGIRESTGVTGEYRGYGRVPGLRESTGVTGEYRGYGRVPYFLKGHIQPLPEGLYMVHKPLEWCLVWGGNSSPPPPPPPPGCSTLHCVRPTITFVTLWQSWH